MHVTAASTTTVDEVLNDLMSIGRHMRKRMTSDGLDPGAYWLLHTIRGGGTQRVTELAAGAGLDPSTVSRHIAQLERAGTVERLPDPDDGRAQRVALTARGESEFGRAHARRRAVLAGTLDAWPPADVDQLKTLLDRLVANLEENLP